eukprot:7185217-Pyramimonas_sp.AAC.1
MPSAGAAPRARHRLGAASIPASLPCSLRHPPPWALAVLPCLLSPMSPHSLHPDRPESGSR